MTYTFSIIYLLFVSVTRNSMPGTIINQPHGKNVYDGVVIDYKGKVGS